jgi:phospholipase/carboxylesterase
MEADVGSKADGARKKARKSENGVIIARPCLRVSGSESGTHPLGLENGRDGVLYVPERRDQTRPAPLVLTLHGAGSNAHDAIQPLRRLADAHGIVLVAPDARTGEWDLLDGGFGADVDFIDHALARAFGRCLIDERRVAIEGFSDGGSYALSLGLRNTELFTHVIAFSPGFVTLPPCVGKPKIFISHGAVDVVLPAVRCSRRIVPRLERDGYAVTYREFEGGHLVPAEIARAAVEWLLQ